MNASRQFPIGLCLLAVVAVLAPPAAAQSEPQWRVRGDRLAGFGRTLAVVPDVDGDGAAELLVSRPRRRSAGGNTGWVGLLSGADGTVLAGWFGDAPPSKRSRPALGERMLLLGDLDGDGAPEYAVAAPGAASAGGKGRPGVVRVRSVIGDRDLFQLVGSSPSARLGHVLGRCGDLDGDGLGELLAREYAGASAVLRVASGVDGATLFTIAAPDGGGAGFARVFAAGDLDGDALDDLVIVSHEDLDGAEAVPLTVSIYSGATRVLLQQWNGSTSSPVAVAVLGDADGDGRDDVLLGGGMVGGVTETHALEGAAVTLHSGADGVVLHRSMRSNPSSGFGSVLAVLEDVNGDGIRDFAVSEPSRQPARGGYGRVHVYDGRNAKRLLTLDPEMGDKTFGNAISCGDLDGDGRLELALHVQILTDAGFTLDEIRVYDI